MPIAAAGATSSAVARLVAVNAEVTPLRAAFRFRNDAEYFASACSFRAFEYCCVIDDATNQTLLLFYLMRAAGVGDDFFGHDRAARFGGADFITYIDARRALDDDT